tara:strand:+ start:801 stop:1166 length:366 start_codon:yes stop_codon:yes gene_type:complete
MSETKNYLLIQTVPKTFIDSENIKTVYVGEGKIDKNSPHGFTSPNDEFIPTEGRYDIKHITIGPKGDLGVYGNRIIRNSPEIICETSKNYRVETGYGSLKLPKGLKLLEEIISEFTSSTKQ